MRLLGGLLKLIVIAFVVATPVLGVWLASSLATYLRGPLWAAVTVGLLLFPGLPFLWEAWAGRRRQRRAERAAGLSGEGHAWNAARIGDGWYLIDATWDAGSLDGRSFVKEYRTDYFMTPPEVFGIDHFPDKPQWQLREKPLDRGDFLRQPALKPGFYAHGLELLEPTRSQIDVRQAALVRVRNPCGLFFLATYEPLGGGTSARCEVQNGPVARIRCAFPAAGAYRVLLFGNRARYGTFGMLGQLDVNNSP